MKQILPELKEVNKHLNFAKHAFTKGGFRCFTQYINGLIALNRKTIKSISEATIDKKHQSLINRVLSKAKFEQELLEKRYLKKVKYILKGQYLILILDDSLVERNGKHIEETQSHKDHNENKFITGHQFFTRMINTSLVCLPLFPILYSKNTESKIEMAIQLVDKLVVEEKIAINAVLFDSWYSDKKLINKCKTKGILVVCGIKSNRNISLKRNTWVSLSEFSVFLTISQCLRRQLLSSYFQRVRLCAEWSCIGKRWR